MENLSHSFSKRSYGGHGFGMAAGHQKSVYDDVFGGPTKFGMPTLAPRLEDYTEIFGGFHPSRGASIPVLDLPVVDEADLPFDVWSSGFDYSEVFGGFKGLDFALSSDDFVRKFNGLDDSSDDAWSPAASESPSDDTDPYAFSDRSQSWVNEDSHYPTSGIRLFDTSYDKANQRRYKSISKLAAKVAERNAKSGSSYMIDENHVSQKVQGPASLAPCDLESNIDFDGGTAEDKKTIYLQRRFDLERHERYHGYVDIGPVYTQNKPFVTVNDINLRTKPSRLPPPLRPPPVYAEKMVASAKLNSKPTDAVSCSFEQTEGDSSPPFFDVEIDGSSSVMASKAVRDSIEKVQVKIRSAKEPTEKREVMQSRSMLLPKSTIRTVEEKVSKSFGSISSYKDDRKVKCAEESSITVPLAEESSRLIEMDQEVSGSVEQRQYLDFAARSKKGRDDKESRSVYQISNKSAQAFAWTQGTEYFEVVEAAIPLKAVAQYKDETKFLQKGSDEFRRCVATEAFKQKEEVKEARASKEASKLEERKSNPEVAAEAYGDGIRSESVSESSSQNKCLKIAKVELNNCESDINEKKMKMGKRHEEIKNLQNDSDKSGANQTKAEMIVVKVETYHNPRGISEHTGISRMLNDAYACKANERKHRDKLEMDKCDARFSKAIELGKTENKEIMLDEKKMKQECHEEQKNKKKLTEVCERKENANMAKEVEHEDNGKRLKKVAEHKGCDNLKKPFENQENNRSHGPDGSATTFVEAKIEESPTMSSTTENGMQDIEECKHQELSGHAKGVEQIIREDKWTEKLNDESANLLGELDKNFGKLETTQATTCEEDEELNTELKEGAYVIDVQLANCLVEETPDSIHQNKFQHENSPVDAINSCCFHKHRSDSGESKIDTEDSLSKLDKDVSERAFDPEGMRLNDCEQEQRAKTTNGVKFTLSSQSSQDNLSSCQPSRDLVENGKITRAALPSVLGDREIHVNPGRKGIRSMEGKEKILNEILAQENNKIEERLQRERELEKEHPRKIEEEREREREREKDRMEVDRVTLEVRDRSYVEAHEREGRPSVERSSVELRQRTMAEAREKLEKSSLEDRERSVADKASVEARLRAERAAVERATLEARQQAFEKAMADKVSSEGRERVERSISDKFCTSSKKVEMRQSSSFSKTGNLNPLQFSYSSVHVGTENESPQRCKARLERYRRTAERAAKALEEKNLRDLVAQREQAERSRLAEILDAEVKRWSSGKEGNLRALLSTLQYILGPLSGWQPIPLTEVITSAAVKKAYRKATLCVHPDKLQQKGASIQQKYICEKVFDLLKEAWNTFNSEER